MKVKFFETKQHKFIRSIEERTLQVLHTQVVSESCGGFPVSNGYFIGYDTETKEIKKVLCDGCIYIDETIQQPQVQSRPFTYDSGE